MRILKVEPGQAPYEKEMEDTLAAIQQEVQGLFQPVYVEDGVILCCNEEGKLNGMAPNRWLEEDIICGPFFLVGDDHEGGFCSLTDDQIQKYTAQVVGVGPFQFVAVGGVVDDTVLLGGRHQSTDDPQRYAAPVAQAAQQRL